jgi:hypothetical protein
MSEQQTRLSTRRVAGRVVSRVVYHAARNRMLILLLVFIGGVWLLFPSAPATTAPTSPSNARANDAAEQYLQALKEHDPSGFVNALSPEARQALEVRFGQTGIGAATAFFREQQSRGQQIVGWERVGSYDTVQGEDIRFYVVHYARGDEKRDIPYMLAIDASGKVARVE